MEEIKWKVKNLKYHLKVSFRKASIFLNCDLKSALWQKAGANMEYPVCFSSLKDHSLVLSENLKFLKYL